MNYLTIIEISFLKNTEYFSLGSWYVFRSIELGFSRHITLCLSLSRLLRKFSFINYGIGNMGKINLSFVLIASKFYSTSKI
jgi:hypothetical protein